jgi:hypothetical protein
MSNYFRAPFFNVWLYKLGSVMLATACDEAQATCKLFHVVMKMRKFDKMCNCMAMITEYEACVSTKFSRFQQMMYNILSS